MPKKLGDLNPAARNKRAAKLAKNPGTRSSIPTKYLKGFAGADKLRAQRALNQRLDTPIVEGSGVTQRQAAQQRTAATNQKFGPAEQIIRDQYRTNDLQQGQTANWFKAYQDQIRGAQAQQQAQQSQFAGQLQGFASGVANADAGVRAQTNQQMQTDAQARGATVDPNIAAQAEQGSAVRQALLGSFASAALNRVNADTLDTGKLGLRVGMQGGEELGRIRGERGKIQQTEQNLAREKGDFATTFMQDLSESERKGVLERLVFGADVAKDNADIDIKRGVDPVTGKKISKPKSPSDKKTEAELDYFDKHGYWPPTGPPNDKKSSGKDQYGNTPKERRRAQNDYATAKTVANKYKGGVDGSWQLLRDFIVTKGIDEPMATAAAQQAILKKVGPNTRAKMAELGIPLVNEPKKTDKVSRPKNAPGVGEQKRPTSAQLGSGRTTFSTKGRGSTASQITPGAFYEDNGSNRNGIVVSGPPKKPRRKTRDFPDRGGVDKKRRRIT